MDCDLRAVEVCHTLDIEDSIYTGQTYLNVTVFSVRMSEAGSFQLRLRELELLREELYELRMSGKRIIQEQPLYKYSQSLNKNGHISMVYFI